ncbi:serine hydrolase domain-containing protein [Sphingomonas glaciei]|uniref:Beta-lactamase family protein n=1 Tax=Sphingomonas glaciei TaxID=2938948 RepID=A0ABY5MUR0_9SPHN|nr:serine hydrolase domain-containing protein [Sphingomonas glaciei]UUR06888.1 beta-lactamase family protein [Sphingomonas glaciei]
MRRGLGLLLALPLAGCMTADRPAPYAPPSEVAWAWARFDASAVRGQDAGGLADRRTGRRMTPDDPIRVASVSKIATALTVMRLVEKGKLDLDADVSTMLGWPLRNPAFPDRAITLRMLLSHTGSFRDNGENYVVRLGKTIRPEAQDPGSFDPAHAPGTFFRYSNLNFGLVGTIIERATGERFDRVARREVLEPLGLDACFNYATCSPAAAARAVVLYDEDGSAILDDLRGKLPACPVFTEPGTPCNLDTYQPGTNGALFSPQGGLRISAAGLTVIGRMLLNDGRHGGRAFLSPASVRTVTAPQWTFDGSNGATDDGFYCSYGLAIQLLPTPAAGCRDDLTGSGRRLVGHAGEAYRVRSGLWLDPATRTGIAFVAANNGKDPPAGRSAFKAVEEWLAANLR